MTWIPPQADGSGRASEADPGNLGYSVGKWQNPERLKAMPAAA
jgi:hypothetical protein